MENGTKPEIKRLYSLDALRGFDMLWITGMQTVFAALAALTGWPVLQWWAGQLHHAQWHGFQFLDMVFPLFLFIAGISFPFSMAKRIANEVSRRSIYMHLISRGLILFILGIFYNNAVRFDFANLRYCSVLGRIGLAWMFAGIIFINTKLSFRIVWFLGLLIGYWLLLILFPAHDLGSTDIYSQEGNLASHIDRLLLPGVLYRGNHDPEGILSTLPAIGTALLGMFTGEFILSQYLKDKPIRKVLYMVLAALGLMIIGKIWNLTFPINKNLWTSSFVCWVGGLSLLLFALLYLVIDVWNYKKWAFFFAVIGMNSITVYLAVRIIEFKSASQFFFSGFIALFPASLTRLLTAIGTFSVVWIFLYFLYKKKIFLRI